MAVLRIPDENRTVVEVPEITARLLAAGVQYERWPTRRLQGAGVTDAEILSAYAAEIERLKKLGGYVTADVISVLPSTPGLDEMLARFNREHWHDEDEVRFVVGGRGLFHIRPRAGGVVAIEMDAGDLIRVPAGTWHWFDLCAEREIKAIRLFQDPAGWTPRYTTSGIELGYQPVCLGRNDLPAGPA
ncbi:MAG TPA: cupin domain-containing protein [Candidatus Polarisedimenticolia bacterium]|nr:cupin domain-containing protein [Candidatus Polarisedimenticolia bacterium]